MFTTLRDDAMMIQVTSHEVAERVCVLTLDMFFMVCRVYSICFEDDIDISILLWTY